MNKNEIVDLDTDNDAPSIGVAWMDDDGTIQMMLRAEGPGIIGDAFVEYDPSSEDYQEVLDHLGGLKPGEYKPVPPWPDEN